MSETIIGTLVGSVVTLTATILLDFVWLRVKIR